MKPQSMPRPSMGPHPSPEPHGADQELADHVRHGLRQTPKALSSRYFYDERGSALFQQIMELPEYYLSRAESALLDERASELVALLAPDNRPLDLFELGSGDGSKTLRLCQALHHAGKAITYHPMDISAHALNDLRRLFAQQLPVLPLQPLCGDYFKTWPITRAGRRQVALFLGSNLGNFTATETQHFLHRVRTHLRPGDGLLLGLDLVKNPHTIRAAYNDSAGITAAFNLNLLQRLNDTLGMDFQIDRFTHYPTYCPLEGTARSFLVSQVHQVVRSTRLGETFVFDAGEVIYTEQSQKYRPEGIAGMAADAGFCPPRLVTDEVNRYTLAWCVAA